MARKISTGVSLRFRLLLGNGRAMGPGKADLLEAIAASGSISAAGRALGMSYKRAWQLVEDLNGSFAEPLVHASKGGERGGGAALTPCGTAVLRTYRRIEKKARTAFGAELRTVARLVRG
ncbi:MAG TPA: LysR family transcriptional regulator [Rudaea sp.]|nr:LysR family transcriptional regulator [Rudaea sp.]